MPKVYEIKWKFGRYSRVFSCRKQVFSGILYILYTIVKEMCDLHVFLLSSNFILAYMLNFR
jgi:hypothetical protein